MSDKFCCRSIWKENKTAWSLLFLNWNNTKNFGCHLVFTVSFLVTNETNNCIDLFISPPWKFVFMSLKQFVLQFFPCPWLITSKALAISRPLSTRRIRDHLNITSAKRWVGGVSKMAIFADLQYYLGSRRWVGGPKKANNMLT